MKRSSLELAVFGVVMVGFMPWAHADLAQLKEYKKAFPGETAKCVTCHNAALPKKDGDVSLNAYGTKVKGLAEKPTAETYTKAGKAA